MKISLIQLAGNDINNYKETASHIIQLTHQCCLMDTDLILLPECSFPGYFIGLSNPFDWTDHLSELKKEISKLAKTYSKYIAIGLADYENDVLVNVLSVFDPTGTIVCSTAKSNLWHFDSNWFQYGTKFPVFDTPFGKIGLMVCADGRIPEIARLLKLQGAQLILDTVNLVSSAETPSTLTNQQYGFILKERAKENNLYIAVCDKCGIEDNSVTMIGRSMVIDPKGNIISECDSVNEQILTCEIDLFNSGNVKQREPLEYSILSEKVQHLPVYDNMNRAYNLKELEYYTGIVKYEFNDLESYKQNATHYINLCQKANCKLIVLPYAKELDLQSIASSLLEASKNSIIVCAGFGCKETLLITDQILCSHSSISNRCIPVANGLSLSFLFDDEYSVPENVRIQMLNGSDLVIWCDSSNDTKTLVKTRCVENKIFTIRTTTSSTEAAYMVNPDGGISATTFRIPEHTVFAMLFTALSRAKTVVPGTDIIMTRHPDAYERLME